MNLAVIGSRSFNNKQLLYRNIDKLRQEYDIVKIVSGGARGADKLGIEYAKDNNISYHEFIPDWKTHGKIAGILRNTDIINAANIVIAFWDGQSKGTLNSINKAKKRDIPIIIV